MLSVWNFSPPWERFSRRGNPGWSVLPEVTGFSEWITADRISVGAPFFNKVNIATGLLLLFLTGVGPLLAWRKTSTGSLKRNFEWPLGAGLVAGVVALGFRGFFSLICLILCIFVASTIGLGVLPRGKRDLGAIRRLVVASAIDLTMRNRRRYSGYIVHVGMVFAL